MPTAVAKVRQLLICLCLTPARRLTTVTIMVTTKKINLASTPEEIKSHIRSVVVSTIRKFQANLEMLAVTSQIKSLNLPLEVKEKDR